MTTKLFKHEFLRTRGLLAGIFGIVVLVALVSFVMSVTQLPLLSALGDGGMVAAAVALTPLVMFGLGYEHWRSSFSGRGYLTHSLPVRGRTQAAVSLVHAFCWSRVAVVIAIALWLLSLVARAITLDAPISAVFDELGAGIRHTARYAPAWGWTVIGVLLLLTLFGYLAQIWFSAAVGSEGRLSGTSWGPVVVYVALYLALQLAALLCLLFVPLVIHLGGPENFQVHPANVLRLMRDKTESMMPLGILLPTVVAPIVLVWRTLKSWDEKVSLA